MTTAAYSSGAEREKTPVRRLRVAQVATKFAAGAGRITLLGALALDPEKYETTIFAGEGGTLVDRAEEGGLPGWRACCRSLVPRFSVSRLPIANDSRCSHSDRTASCEAYGLFRHRRNGDRGRSDQAEDRAAGADPGHRESHRRDSRSLRERPPRRAPGARASG